MYIHFLGENMKSLIQKLTETFSPSGYEFAIREVIRSEVEALADEVRVDALGNLIVRKGTKARTASASCWPPTWTRSA